MMVCILRKLNIDKEETMEIKNQRLHLHFVRIIVCIMMVAMMMTIVSPLTLFAKGVTQGTEYAEVDFGSGSTYRCKASRHTGLQAVTKAGRAGVKTNLAGGLFSIYLDIDDSFMYNIPNDTPVDVTVEYYDEFANSMFCVIYDSHNLSPDIANNTKLNHSEAAYGKGTKQWQSYTFRITDLLATNRDNERSDLRLTAWVPGKGNSATDITFGKITVKYGDYYEYLEFDGLNSQYVGNVFSKEENIKLNVNLIGRAMNDTAVGEVRYKVYDKNDKFLYSGKQDVEAGFKERVVAEIEFPNPGAYGLYDIELEIDAAYKSDPERKTSTKITRDFSVAMVFDPAENNHNRLLGVCQQIGMKHRGGRRETAEMVARAGFGYIRDDSCDAVYQGGKFVVTDEFLEMYRMIKEDYGIEPFVILETPQTIHTTTWSFNNPPHTEEQYRDFAQYCHDVAEQTKGIVSHFELWNEYNLKTRENDPLASPEYYANFMRPAAKRIKEANPEAKILGITAAGETKNGSDRGTAPVFTKSVFEAGGHEGLDYVSVHPYDWSKSFRTDRFIRDAKELKEVIAEYGSGQEIWMDEFGWGTCADKTQSQSFERDRQYQLAILQLALSQYYCGYSKAMYYNFIDGDDPNANNYNWGLVNYYDAQDKTPYGAKEAYIAMTAYNQFFGNSVPDKAFSEDDSYAFHYYNERMGKDVALLITNVMDKNISLDLGTDLVELYDAYGNKLADISSDDNIYDFTITQDPVYIVGNFGSFEKVTTREHKIEASNTNCQAAVDDMATFQFTKNTDAQLTIKVEGAEVAENNGFIDNVATLKVKTPMNSGQKIRFNVTVSDEVGNVYYAKKHSVELVDPVILELSTERSDNLNKNRWRMRVKVKNVSSFNTYAGQVEVLAPSNMAEYNKPKRFERLEPGEELTFFCNMPEKVNKNIIESEIRIKLDNGFETKVIEKKCFSQAVYAHKKPVIDGINDADEWNCSWIGSSDVNNIVNLMSTNWGGADDLSYSAAMMWDENNFYFMAAVTDDVHFVNHTPNGISNMWRGDSIQFAVDDRESTNTVMTSSFSEITVGDVPGVGAVAYKQKGLYESGLAEKSEISDAEVAIKRYNGYTLYECAIPWDSIFYEGYVLNPDAPFKFSALVNDNDGDGRKFYIEYTGGIGTNKDASMFGEMTFTQ